MQTDFPLYYFFIELRKKDFSLGIDEYYALIEVLQGGFAIKYDTGQINVDELLTLCKTLWLKPYQSPRIFEEIFTQYLTHSEYNISDKQNQGISSSSEDKFEQNNKNAPISNEHKKDSDTSQVVNFENEEKQKLKIFLGNPKGEQTNIGNDQDKEEKKEFILTKDYFPINYRQLTQLWKRIPEKISIGFSKQIDISETIQSIAQKGFITAPIQQKLRQSINQVIIFTDHQGSMIAFEQLSDLIYSSLQESFNDHKTKPKNVLRYYFYNVLQDYAYQNPAHTQYERLDDLVRKYKNKRTAIIIISDGGAARGSNSNVRAKATIRMIFQLREITNKIVWLNPLPQDRWENTSAKRIARFVEMYHTEPRDIKTAINFLTGKIPSEIL